MLVCVALIFFGVNAVEWANTGPRDSGPAPFGSQMRRDTMSTAQDSQKHGASTSPKREAILAAALEAFSTRGVNGVAVPEIAERASVGTGTIYRYFESKEALVNALFCEQKRALRRYLFEELTEDGDPRAQFAAFWDRLVRFARQRPASFRFLELQDHLPYLDADSLALQARVLRPMRDACQRMQARGVFRDDIRPEVLMTLVWGAFVQLFKSERTGCVRLTGTDIDAARDACWRLCTT